MQDLDVDSSTGAIWCQRCHLLFVPTPSQGVGGLRLGQVAPLKRDAILWLPS